MKLRLLQIILFFPCCIIDAITLATVLLPMYVICGTKVVNREPLLQWLFELNKQD